MENLLSNRFAHLPIFLVFLMTLLLISPNESFSYSTSTGSGAINNSDRVYSGPFQYEAKVENGDYISTFKIEKEGKVYYEQSISFGYVEKVTQWNFENNNYFIVQYRYDGSGASMFVEVIELKEKNVERIVETVEQAMADTFIKQNELILTYGKYSEGDATAFPSQFESIIYKYETNTIVKYGPYNGNLVEKTRKEQEQYGKLSTGDEPVTGENPSWEEMNKLLTEEALKQGVPPEIVKAIAWQETDWLHFYIEDKYNSKGEKVANKGDLVVSFDGGIGIMQLTFRDPNDYVKYGTTEEKIKVDVRENIRVGIAWLLKEKFKWRYIPGINVTYSEENPETQIRNPEILENWYFGIMAYNGVSRRNDPRISLEERIENNWPKEAYQDTIYKHIEKYGHIKVNPFPNPNESLNFGYVEDSHIMNFKDYQMEYTIKEPLTRSHHVLETEKVRYVKDEVNFRATPEIPKDNSKANVIRVLKAGELVYVVNEKVFPLELRSHFIWYKVMTHDGHVGYVASGYIGEKLGYLDLSEDSPNPYGYLEVSLLAGKKIINGYPDGTFRPNNNLTREQAALMFVRALNLPIVEVESTGFVDVTPSNSLFYKEIAAAKAAGIFKGSEREGGLHFLPHQELTRGEMAAVLVRAYELTQPTQEEPPPSDGGNGSEVTKQSSDGEEDRGHPFTDIIGHIFEPYIKILYQNEITNGVGDGTTYGINMKIKRVDFSRLLYKTILLKEGSIF